MYSCTLKRSDFVKIENKYPKNPKYTRACGDILSRFDEFYALAMTEKTETEDGAFGFYVTAELPEDITAGFDKLVFVIKPQHREIIDRVCSAYTGVETEYVYQDYSSIPSFYKVQ